MKKYSLIGGIGLLIVVLWAMVFFFTKKDMPFTLPFLNTTTNSLLDYLPDTTDQVMFLEVNSWSKSFIMQSNEQIDPTTLSSTLDTLEHIAVAQATNEQGENFAAVFLQWNESFSIDQVQAIGLLYLDTWFESKEIAPQLWIYADTSSMTYFTTLQTPLSKRKEIQQILRERKAKDASILFYSRPTIANDGWMLTNAFANKLQYSVLYGNPSRWNSKWSFVLQFSGTSFQLPEQIFSPHYDTLIHASTLLYLESKHLLSSFGFDANQFALAFPLLLKQVIPSIDSLLSTKQVASLYNALDNNLGVFLDIDNNPFGMGIHLVFNTADSYDILTTLAPARRALATWFLWSSQQLSEQKTENLRSLQMQLPNILSGMDSSTTSWMDTWPSLSLITLSKSEKHTILSLLAPKTIEDSNTRALQFWSDSLLSFRIDQGAIQQEWLALNPYLANLVAQSALLGSWVILGDIRIDEKNQQLVLNFETK